LGKMYYSTKRREKKGGERVRKPKPSKRNA